MPDSVVAEARLLKAQDAWSADHCRLCSPNFRDGVWFCPVGAALALLRNGYVLKRYILWEGSGEG